MLRFVIPLVLTLAASASDIRIRSKIPRRTYFAASESQMRFAIENKYDNTGPGAKQPEYAYNTYKTLEDALINYLDDPDTKLPEQERAIAIQRLTNPDYSNSRPEITRQLPKTVEAYTRFNPQEAHEIVRNQHAFPERKLPYYLSPNINILRDHEHNIQRETSKLEPFRFGQIQKPQIVKGNPLSLAYYTREADEEAIDQFNPNPKYTFSYGVNDKDTSDRKSAHETREGGVVRGFYSYMDPDGKQRTVHYTADDKLGFRATVQRTDS